MVFITMIQYENRYFPLIFMQGANAALAQRFIERADDVNVLQALVETENLATRNAQRYDISYQTEDKFSD